MKSLIIVCLGFIGGVYFASYPPVRFAKLQADAATAGLNRMLGADPARDARRQFAIACLRIKTLEECQILTKDGMARR